VNNDGIIQGDPADVDSPPNGSRLRVRYDNGDDVSVRFREWADAAALARTYPIAVAQLGTVLKFPLVSTEAGTVHFQGTERGGHNLVRRGAMTVAPSGMARYSQPSVIRSNFGRARGLAVAAGRDRV